MKIDKYNLEQNEVYLHDSNMICIKQDLEKHSLEITFENRYTEYMVRYILKFFGTVYYESTNYSPWYTGHRVNGLTFEDPTLFKRLLNLPNELNIGCNDNLPESDQDFIQPEIQFLSGDKLRILCKYVEVSEESLL